MKRLLWSIPAIALYFYVATTLTNYGFISYFGIPQSFLNTSLTDNIVFFYQLLTAYGSVLNSVHWYVTIALGFAAGVIIALCWFSKTWKGFLAILGTAALLLYLSTFFALGGFIAQNQTSFVVPSGCTIGPAYAYIVPTINNDVTIFVPINQENKMTGGFIVKNTADSMCTFQWKPIGKVTP